MPKKTQIKKIQGMKDILPEEQRLWQKVEKITEQVANFYDFSRIEVPILEMEELFVKGTGKDTEIVEKQMFGFRTKGGEKVVLRPEFTPGLIRTYIENGMEVLPKPVKIWTMGPVFRHEKPQKGRQREFHQFDFEIIAVGSPVVDALLIQLSLNILKGLSILNTILLINSLGCKECQPSYIRRLKKYFKGKTKALCPNCKKRLEKNPFRILDCKEEKCQRIKKFAPQIVNSLCENCNEHFQKVIQFLNSANIPYTLDPYLVRGLDYYTKTVFEIVPKGKEEIRQATLIGGGRYDNLVKELGGKSTPAVGMAGGIERIIEEIKEMKIKIKVEKEDFCESPEIFLVQLGELAKKKSFALIEEFKNEGIKIAENLGKDSLKSQLALADKMNVKYSLLLGQKEAQNETIIIRNMKSGIQRIVPTKEIIKEIKYKLKE